MHKYPPIKYPIIARGYKTEGGVTPPWERAPKNFTFEFSLLILSHNVLSLTLWSFSGYYYFIVTNSQGIGCPLGWNGRSNGGILNAGTTLEINHGNPRWRNDYVLLFEIGQRLQGESLNPWWSFSIGCS